MNTPLDIADAVVTELNAQSFTQSFTAVRNMTPDYQIRDLTSLKVTVMPTAVEMKQFARGLWSQDHGIDVAVQKRLTDDTETSVVAMMDLTQEVAEYLRSATLTTLSSVRVAGAKIDPIYAVEHMSGMKVFTSVIQLTYKE